MAAGSGRLRRLARGTPEPQCAESKLFKMAVHMALLAAAAGLSGAASDPADWPAFANESCHAATPAGHVIRIDNVTHAQCAAACAAKQCGCFDMTAQGSCDGTAEFWGFRKSSDRTAWTNSTVPSPPPPPPRPTGPFSLHPTLGDNVVLQRAPARAAIFGWGRTASATITVHFRGKTYEGTVAPNSSNLDALMWRVELPPTPASTVPENITVEAAGTTVTLTNVLFGDVWACGGQSNMAVPLDETFEWFHPDICNDTDYPINVMAFPHVNGINYSTIHVANGNLQQIEKGIIIITIFAVNLRNNLEPNDCFVREQMI